MNVPSVNFAIRSGVHHLGGRGRGVAAGGNVMSNVTTTTSNTDVVSANIAVSIGRWSSLAIIASSFLSLWEGGCLYSAFRNHQLALRLIDTTSFVAVC